MCESAHLLQSLPNQQLCRHSSIRPTPNVACTQQIEPTVHFKGHFCSFSQLCQLSAKGAHFSCYSLRVRCWLVGSFFHPLQQTISPSPSPSTPLPRCMAGRDRQQPSSPPLLPPHPKKIGTDQGGKKNTSREPFFSFQEPDLHSLSFLSLSFSLSLSLSLSLSESLNSEKCQRRRKRGKHCNFKVGGRWRRERKTEILFPSTPPLFPLHPKKIKVGSGN